MPTYRAPVDDFRFILTELYDASQLTAYQAYADISPDLMMSIVEEAGKFCEEVLAPINASGDAEGCTWEQGVVRTPSGFKEAFRAYADGGWIGLASDPEHGGQGLPLTLRFVVDEMVVGSNLSFAMYPGLSQGAIDAIHTHGSEEQKAFYLPRLASGEWTGTMCLTEAHAGTDLGIIRTRARQLDDGTYRVTGQKIFITAGEHDLTANICHLVLAKLPGAAEGTRGISMFLVPKFVPNTDGSLGARNGVTCGSIEHKMGIKGSATCVLNFDEAVGYLVGDEGKGMRAMFTMMNSARLGVGIQGLGLATASYHNAVTYARERQQGRSLSGVKNPEGEADPIIVHAETRRSLLAMRAFIEGARALSTWTGMLIDQELLDPDAAKRAEAADLVALLTPIIKALFTDLGFESTNIGLQLYGGHGYIREWGMEQFVRDARIGQIYEGTNHIQALDLVGRKLAEGDGRLVRRFAEVVAAELQASGELPALAMHVQALADAIGALRRATAWLAGQATGNADELGAAANEYLRLFGYVALGHQWLRTARVAQERLASGGAFPAVHYEAKLATAQFYFARVMPQVHALHASITAGAGAILAFPMEAY
ncbi:MAG: acyl-CoA dehydrogenase C-terminal domain-containing protein [Gemmatimonadaceae bacterium]|nr:acyl-CoA dehydrogenase C-terminal domain-containing protein [Gemmatimonadaceae bacterium]